MHLGCSVPCFSQLIIKEFVCPWLFTNWDHQLWFVYVNYDLSQTQQKLHSVPTALGVKWAWISARKPCCTPWTNHHPNLKMVITRRYGMIWRYKSSSFRELTRYRMVAHSHPQPFFVWRPGIRNTASRTNWTPRDIWAKSSETLGLGSWPRNMGGISGIYKYLVGGLELDFYDFPYIGNNHPNWLLYIYI